GRARAGAGRRGGGRGSGGAGGRGLGRPGAREVARGGGGVAHRTTVRTGADTVAGHLLPAAAEGRAGPREGRISHLVRRGCIVSALAQRGRHDVSSWRGAQLHTAGCPSGQRDLTVNQTAQPSGVRIPHLPPERRGVTHRVTPRRRSRHAAARTGPGLPDAAARVSREVVVPGSWSPGTAERRRFRSAPCSV